MTNNNSISHDDDMACYMPIRWCGHICQHHDSCHWFNELISFISWLKILLSFTINNPQCENPFENLKTHYPTFGRCLNLKTFFQFICFVKHWLWLLAKTYNVNNTSNQRWNCKLDSIDHNTIFKIKKLFINVLMGVVSLQPYWPWLP